MKFMAPPGFAPERPKAAAFKTAVSAVSP